MTLKTLTPMLTVPDMEEAICFYRDILGFACLTRFEGWAALAKDRVEVMICLPSAHEPPSKPTLTGSLYFRYDNVDALWEAFKDKATVVYPIENFFYGMREFGIRDNNGYMLQFGQSSTIPCKFRRRSNLVNCPGHSPVRDILARISQSFSLIIGPGSSVTVILFAGDCMMVTRRFLLLSIVFTLLAMPVLAQNSTATQTREGGLVTTTFTVPNAKITVTLPDEVAAGDTISGTVVPEPAGKNDAKKQHDSDTLSGYVIEVGNQKASPSGNIIIHIKLQAKDVVKLSLAGRTVATAPVPLLPANTPLTGTPHTFTLPTVAQEGRPIQIQGPFDGDSSNTKVTIGGSAARVLAESPRQVVVANPSTTAGPTTIEVKENNTSSKGTCRNLKIDMTAPKTSLKKGESTELHVQVSGLDGIREPVPLQLTNQSPNTVNLGGGNTQTIVIQPSQVAPGGIFVKTLPVTGIRSGSFVITSNLPAPRPRK